MNEKDKKILVEMAKSLHKCFMKAMAYEDSKKGKDVIEDVIDENYEAEANPSKVPVRNTGVMVKSKYSKKEVANKAAQTLVKKYKEHKKDNL